MSEFNVDKILGVMGNMTDLLLETFPNTTIYPSMGNHDSFPAHQLPAGNSTYYEQILKASHWDKMLNPSNLETFKKGKL